MFQPTLLHKTVLERGEREGEEGGGERERGIPLVNESEDLGPNVI